MQFLAQAYEAFRYVDAYTKFSYQYDFFFRFNERGFYRKGYAFKRRLFDACIYTKTLALGYFFAYYMCFLVYFSEYMDNRSQNFRRGGAWS